MPQKHRILICDEDPQITHVLRTRLAARGYDVRVAADGESAFDTFNDWQPNLVVTNLVLSNMNGLELCRHLRTVSQVPIIVLSVKGEEKTKVELLDAGADDFIMKPFSMEEFLARVRATLRRAAPSPGESDLTVLEATGFHLDVEKRKAIVLGKEIHLTPTEFDLLAYLMRHAGKVLTHRKLLGAIWGSDYGEETEYLRVFIGQLRKKIEPNPASPRYILTQSRIGYRFEPGA